MNRSNASGEANFSTDFRVAFELGPVRSVSGGGEIAPPSLAGTDLVADAKTNEVRMGKSGSGHRNPNLRRDLCSSVNDGAGYSGMVGLGEAYFGAFFLAIGATDIQIGMLSTVPYLLGSLYQLLTPWGVRRFYSFRRWVVFNAGLQATALLAISLLTFALRADFWNVLLLLSLYWSGGLATSPVWNTWIEFLIPGRIRKQFLAARMGTSQLVMLLAMPAAGLAIQASSQSGYELVCFGTLLLAAASSRYYSTYMLGRKSEHESWVELAAPTKAALDKQANSEQTREDALRVAWMAIPFFAAMHFSMFIAGPYYAPFMLRNMELNYLHFMFLIVLSFVGRVLMLRWTGQLAKRYGTGWVLMLGSAGLVPLAGLWYFYDSFLFLCGLQLVSGAAWGCYEYGVMMLLVEKVTGPKRLAILSWINSCNGLGMVAGMLVGGGLLRYFGEGDATFVTIFILSSVCRLLSLSLFPYRLLRAE